MIKGRRRYIQDNAFPNTALVSKRTDERVEELEQMIDKYDARLEPLTKFLVPGETAAEAFLNVARTVVRRAERSYWKLHAEEGEEVNEVDIRYLNRLSDVCYILGRAESELK